MIFFIFEKNAAFLILFQIERISVNFWRFAVYLIAFQLIELHFIWLASRSFQFDSVTTTTLIDFLSFWWIFRRKFNRIHFEWRCIYSKYNHCPYFEYDAWDQYHWKFKCRQIVLNIAIIAHSGISVVLHWHWHFACLILFHSIFTVVYLCCRCALSLCALLIFSAAFCISDYIIVCDCIRSTRAWY